MSAYRQRFEVPWADTDAARIVWFGNYVRYVDASEAGLFASVGQPLTEILTGHQILLPRTHFECSYRSPARFADVLIVDLDVASVSEHRIALAFEILHEATSRQIAHGHYRIACVDAVTFAARAFPDDVLAALGRIVRPLGH